MKLNFLLLLIVICFSEKTRELSIEKDETTNHEETYGDESTHLTEVTRSETIPEIVPDSMDLKINFIDQLQDKLATLNKNKTLNSTKPKWSKNTSGNSLLTTPQANNNETVDSDATSMDHETTSKPSVSETESQMLANFDFMDVNVRKKNADETVMSEEQALRELNDSRSKWGLSSGGNENACGNRKKGKSIDKVNEILVNVFDPRANHHIKEVMDQKFNYKH